MTDLLPIPAGTTSVFADLPDDYDGWVAYGRRLATADTTLTWAIGDWLLFGADRFPDRYLQAAAAVGMAQGTLRNAASVCQRVSPDRRRPELPWSVHVEVAHLSADDQVRLLGVAADNGLSVRAMRAVVQQEAEDRHDVVTPASDTEGTPAKPVNGSTAPDPGTPRSRHAVEVEVDEHDEDRALDLLRQVSLRLADVLIGEGVREPKIEVR